MKRLKYITEAALRQELHAIEPESYLVPRGQKLTPAAREYLQTRKIKILLEERQGKTSPRVVRAPSVPAAPDGQVAAAKFVDYETGAFYTEKPEHMTHLSGNLLVQKSHPRILFRGKLDSLQAAVVLAQSEIAARGGSKKLLDDLSDILHALREMMRCDVLEEPFVLEKLIGLTHAELRAQSHDPQRYFGVQAMTLPDYTMGRDFALLNTLRTAVRETEVAAAEAFRENVKCTREDLIEELNRMSSALHIMMCRYLAGQYTA
ncbi:MAG: ATP-binding protein [Agathobaculum sp.]|uniref:ATP-binding protein n=1 Tax=Agathobaculum sp. TaxID=2048138 RepID=UPI003D8D7E1A